MSSDCYEARVSFWVNVPRVTHKVMLDGEPIGRVWSDGHIEIDEPSTPRAPGQRLTDAP